MAKVIVCGGGICGLGTALLLARDGHAVTLLERDGSPLPDSAAGAWDAWERHGVAQFRQPHNFMPGLRQVLEAELPEVEDALGAAGAYRWDLLGGILAVLPDKSPRPIDEKLSFWTARRPAGEWVFARAVHDDGRIDVRRGVQATGLLTGPSVADGIVHVVGVKLSDGTELRGDVVVDSMGRRSRSPEWLADAGAVAPEEIAEDCGFTYYTRYFGGEVPRAVGPPLMHMGSISLLRLPGDNDTWSLTVFAASGDRPLRRLRDVAVWTKVVESCAVPAPWLEGEPISDIHLMSGIMDRYRRFVIEGRPVATGFFAVADAWSCTNPSAGRGLTVGFKHAVCLRDTLRSGFDDPLAAALQFHEVTETEVAPWYWAQIAADRARIAEIEAICEGREPPPPADELTRFVLQMRRLAPRDADVARAFLEYMGTITPAQRLLERDDLRTRIEAVAGTAAEVPPPPTPGPDRKTLLELVG
jgi:2-polyprenyl-6-methoxyphenol hydroxylase-like FAD-dependent oxidoreductase